jgi:hypothetical protein
MNASILPFLRLLVALSGLVFAASALMAQGAQDTKPATSNASPAGAATMDGGAKPAKKVQNPTADKKPKPGEYATESEARAHCSGTIVWVDQDHFNHSAGSREYGRKPGAFACERG